jgi:hypothetical protein
LTAYQANELSPEEDERLQEHLAACRHCTEMLLELEEFLRPSEAEVKSGADLEPAEDQRRLGREPAELSKKDRHRTSLRIAYSLTAALAVALVGVSIYAGSLRSELRRPVPEMESGALLARGSQRSASGRAETLRVPTTLTLEVSSLKTFPEYQVDFEGQDGKVIRSVHGAQLQEDRFIRIWLPKHALESGEYQVILWGLQGGLRENLGTYDLRIMT